MVTNISPTVSFALAGNNACRSYFTEGVRRKSSWNEGRLFARVECGQTPEVHIFLKNVKRSITVTLPAAAQHSWPDIYMLVQLLMEQELSEEHLIRCDGCWCDTKQ